MSYFDPHRLYYHSNRKTHKGQIIQKRFVNHDNAFSKEDLERSFRVLTAYGYYFSKTPPTESLCKTLSFSQRVAFGSDQILNLSEIFNSSVRSAALAIDPTFFDTSPLDLRHFYIYFSISDVHGYLTGPLLQIQLYDRANEIVSFDTSNTSYISIYPSSSSLVSVIHAPTTIARSELDSFSATDNGYVALVSIALDDVDFYSMLYSNDYSTLADVSLISLSQSTGTFYSLVNYSLTYINFD